MLCHDFNGLYYCCQELTSKNKRQIDCCGRPLLSITAVFAILSSDNNNLEAISVVEGKERKKERKSIP